MENTPFPSILWYNSIGTDKSLDLISFSLIVHLLSVVIMESNSFVLGSMKKRTAVVAIIVNTKIIEK